MHVRGSIVMPSKPIDLGGGLMTSGRIPGLGVFVRGNSGRLMRDFRRFCERHGLHAEAVHEEADAYQVVGTVEALERLMGHPSVRETHLIMNVRPPRFAGPPRDAQTGVPQLPAGPMPKDASANVRREVKRRSMSKDERIAEEVRQERKLLSKEERERIEVREAVALEEALA